MSDLPPRPNQTNLPAAATRAERLSWIARARRRALDSSAQRVHDRIAASGESGSSSSAGLLAFCVLVLVVAVACVAWLAWATFQPKNAIGWIAVGLGWVVVYEIVPRRERADVRELPSGEFPQVARLVRDIANGVGVAPPRVIATSTDFNAAVMSLPWRRGTMLVIGLPLWTCLPSDQRAALIAHELGHLRGKDTLHGKMVAAAYAVLFGLATLLTPLPRDAYSEFYADFPNTESSQAFSNAMGAALLRVLSLPFVGLLLVFERLAAAESQRREYRSTQHVMPRRVRESSTHRVQADLPDLPSSRAHGAGRTASARGAQPTPARQQAGQCCGRAARVEDMHPPHAHRNAAAHRGFDVPEQVQPCSGRRVVHPAAVELDSCPELRIVGISERHSAPHDHPPLTQCTGQSMPAFDVHEVALLQH